MTASPTRGTKRAPSTRGPVTAAFRRRLLAHYDARKRVLPWRGERDPYRIWVSEVMLQQTRVETVAKRWPAFLAEFPTLERLAGASQDRVLKAWEGLGYYARARNLLRAARAVLRRFDGRLPDERTALQSLPGFGPYTSAAVASIAFARPVAVVDGNVRRVLARLLCERRDAGSAAFARSMEVAAGAALDRRRPGDWNQAMMDLGATVCVPRAPRCPECPVARWCAGRRSGLAESLPAKRRKKPVPHVDVAVGVVRKGDGILIGRRPSEGLLGGLHEFPGGKRRPSESFRAACAREVREETGLAVEVGRRIAVVHHAYSHFRVTIHAFLCRPVSGRLRARGTSNLRFVRTRDLSRYAFPRANVRILAALPGYDPAAAHARAAVPSKVE